MTDGTTPGSVESEGVSTEPDPPATEHSSEDSLERDATVPSRTEAVVLAAARLADGRTPGLRPDDPWAEAGRKVLRFHLAKMLARVPGVIAGEDAEEVHAMRVAARRMRAAWRVFGGGFERDAERRYRRELRDIGASLGVVRDLDVLIEILATYGEHRAGRQRAGLEPLLAAWRAERESRRIELIGVLGSERFGAFVAD